MNYIAKLQQDNKELNKQLEEIAEQVRFMRCHYMGPKFQGPENDYVHVSTDLMSKLNELAWLTIPRITLTPQG